MPSPSNFAPKWALLSKVKQGEIYAHAVAEGAVAAARLYATEVNMNEKALEARLRKYLKQTGRLEGYAKKDENEKPKTVLTKQEKLLLKGLSEGTMGLEEASKVVAVKVFEKMLSNPDDFKYVDFFRTELLKIKQQENTDRNTWATELMHRMFSGHLPPRNCPKCGYEIIKLTKAIPFQEGKIINEVKPLPAPGNS